ncbi:putative membrane protein [Acinetobacter baumannii 1437282]|nr:putative membrane protein [Acinetobacter baumannii 1437282]
MKAMWKGINKFRFISFMFLLMTLKVLHNEIAAGYQDLVFIAYLTTAIIWFFDSAQSLVNFNERGK